MFYFFACPSGWHAMFFSEEKPWVRQRSGGRRGRLLAALGATGGSPESGGQDRVRQAHGENSWRSRDWGAPAEEERRSGRSRTPGRGASPCRAKGIAQDLALPRTTRAGARPPRAQQEDETGLSNLLFCPDLLSHFEFSLFLCFIG